jgi:hypothetical protein
VAHSEKGARRDFLSPFDLAMFQQLPSPEVQSSKFEKRERKANGPRITNGVMIAGRSIALRSLVKSQHAGAQRASSVQVSNPAADAAETDPRYTLKLLT